MLKLLIVCAIISIVVDMSFADASHRKIAWIEGTAILIAVFVVSSVGAWNDYKKEEQFLKLNALSEEDNISTVRREGGEEKVVRHNDLKVGEIIKIKAGMDIPVDGIVLHQSGLLVTEAAMTGEPDELKKDTLDACL